MMSTSIKLSGLFMTLLRPQRLEPCIIYLKETSGSKALSPDSWWGPITLLRSSGSHYIILRSVRIPQADSSFGQLRFLL